jgi:hypothetical protein
MEIHFKSKEVLFEWLFMPSGLKNALGNFMRFMDDMLQPLTKSVVMAYLDDMFIFNKTWAEHF